MTLDAWIYVTLGAATVQNVRAVLQKRLLGRLSVSGATYARFVYGLPLAWIAVAIALHVVGGPLPQPNLVFAGFIGIGALTQILGNALFIHLIRASNFTVMTTYIKVETVIGAILSFLILHDRLSALGVAGVLVTLLGVVVLSAARSARSIRAVLASFLAGDAMGGIGVGALYAVASTSYRGGALALGEVSPVAAALFTLACVTLLQTMVMTGWLAVRSPVILRECFRAWKDASWIGISGIVASALWYIAFAMQVTPYVLALGQIELIFAYMASRFLFREHTHAGEIAGIMVTVVGILVVVAAR